MLIKLYSNQITESSSEAENAKLNIFNMFVSHSTNSLYMEKLYLTSFNYMKKLQLEEEIEEELIEKKQLFLNKTNEFNEFVEENNNYVWEKFSEEFLEKRRISELKLKEELKVLEAKVLEVTLKLKQYNFYFTLNFDFFVYFLKNHYKKVRTEFFDFLKNTKNLKLLYIISYYLTKHKLKNIIIDLINELKLSKELCTLFTKTYDYEIIINLISKHSRKIVNFAIIYQILIQNKTAVLKDLEIEKINNVHITYIYKHLEKTQPKGLS